MIVVVCQTNGEVDREGDLEAVPRIMNKHGKDLEDFVDIHVPKYPGEKDEVS